MVEGIKISASARNLAAFYLYFFLISCFIGSAKTNTSFENFLGYQPGRLKNKARSPTKCSELDFIQIHSYFDQNTDLLIFTWKRNLLLEECEFFTESTLRARVCSKSEMSG